MDNRLERAKFVRAMETVCRAVNDEDALYNHWFPYGVGDGDIDDDTSLEDIASMYCDDDEIFQEVLSAFGRTMKAATKGVSRGAFYFGKFIS